MKKEEKEKKYIYIFVYVYTTNREESSNYEMARNKFVLESLTLMIQSTEISFLYERKRLLVNSSYLFLIVIN